MKRELRAAKILFIRFSILGADPLAGIIRSHDGFLCKERNEAG
jgi:hypothetical protein